MTIWVVIVPVKPLAAAKSRLAHPDRAALALAMAQDTVAAASSVGRGTVEAVMVVTNDDVTRAGMAALSGPDAAEEAPTGGIPPGGGTASGGTTGRAGRGRIVVIPDAPDTGLNAALAHGATVAARRWPGAGVAALSADLAALRPAQLHAALLAMPAGGRGLVADADGTGTVLLAAAAGTPLAPRFGPASRAAHIRSGARDLTAPLGESVRGLRRDVDTIDHLREAVGLGVGPRTRHVLSTGPLSTGSRPLPAGR
ncbi:2-phospho-L-lactate guanylyltransferase [Candidatus Protofrankia californiensis]|uniref:2-phospho-L-lactate guanylyltransferase n=1 Tax=Candidatus Protofrankia californiensis TaxID=1839754 RepID=UPI0010419816|nr:2-phospho-L-lactate guanylyltransferase [Candidatus Protofrankia californiensis]